MPPRSGARVLDLPALHRRSRLDVVAAHPRHDDESVVERLALAVCGAEQVCAGEGLNHPGVGELKIIHDLPKMWENPGHLPDLTAGECQRIESSEARLCRLCRHSIPLSGGTPFRYFLKDKQYYTVYAYFCQYLNLVSTQELFKCRLATSCYLKS